MPRQDHSWTFPLDGDTYTPCQKRLKRPGRLIPPSFNLIRDRKNVTSTKPAHRISSGTHPASWIIAARLRCIRRTAEPAAAFVQDPGCARYAARKVCVAFGSSCICRREHVRKYGVNTIEPQEPPRRMRRRLRSARDGRESKPHSRRMRGRRELSAGLGKHKCGFRRNCPGNGSLVKLL